VQRIDDGLTTDGGAMPVGGYSASRFRRAHDGSRGLVIAGLACMVLVGCASPGSSATAPPSPVAPSASSAYSAELCSAAAEFQGAANALVSLDAKQVGADGVKKALQDLQTAASNLAQAAREQFGPQVDELEKAIASLKATISRLSDLDSLSTNLGKIAAAVGAVEQAAEPIMDSIRAGCPSVPPVTRPSA
jgi:hypothetical protein